MGEPLITKHRPITLDNVVGHGTCIARLKDLAARAEIPHLLFTGPPGVGKTTVAKALCHDIYGEGWQTYVLQMNASDERGIDVVRGRIKKFAGSVSTSDHFNIIILDEADHLTPDAQAALRMTMEEYSANCRFILCANYSNKIIEPIKDRCAYYRFKPLEQGQIASVISKVAEQEGYNLDGLASSIASASKGSLRKALNILSQLSKEPTSEELQQVIPSLDKVKTHEVLKLAFGKNYKEAERAMVELLWDGHEAGEILDALADDVMESSLNSTTKVTVMAHIAKVEYRILFGCSPNIQLRSLIASLAQL